VRRTFFNLHASCGADTFRQTPRVWPAWWPSCCPTARRLAPKLTFGRKSASEIRQIVDLDRVRIIVTGGNSGIGKATAGALAEQASAELAGNVEVRHLDLADLSSVRRFTDSVETVDVLVNNAGVMSQTLPRTADGFEPHIGTNYLGHFALTCLLGNKIKDRVISVGSASYMFGRIRLDDPDQRVGDARRASLRRCRSIRHRPQAVRAQPQFRVRRPQLPRRRPRADGGPDRSRRHARLNARIPGGRRRTAAGRDGERGGLVERADPGDSLTA
jgi:hypothetical protein